jgi:ribosome production factor 1
LQEIGPRFTLKLRWIKKGIPAVYKYGEEAKPLVFDTEPFEVEEKEAAPTNTAEAEAGGEGAAEASPKYVVPPKADEYLWAWKVRFSFFLSRLSNVNSENKLCSRN